MGMPARKHSPSHICAFKRLCRACGYYRSTVAGSRRLLPARARSQAPDKGFVCADCVRGGK